MSLFDDLPGLPAASFRAPPAQSAWMQIDVALVRTEGSALPSARALFGAVLPLLGRWYEEGTLHGWFFMRKPPDVRLRFCLTRDVDDAALAIARALQALHERGDIGAFSRSDYAPEEARFGGPRGMALAHAYWNADSTLWCALDALDARGMRMTSADVLLPAAIHHLFERCCGAGRAIGAWRMLAALVEAEGAEDAEAAVRPAALDALAEAPGLYARERAALQAYAAANARLCTALGHERSLLDRPPAEIAATIAFFDLNRHGFPGERSARMVTRVIAALAAGSSERQQVPDAERPDFHR